VTKSRLEENNLVYLKVLALLALLDFTEKSFVKVSALLALIIS